MLLQRFFVFSLSVCVYFAPVLVQADAQPRNASNPILEFKDADTKTRYYDLLEELRCLVCQNQSLADSGAGLAQDLRQQVYDLVQKGASNDEVTDFMVTRYGDFVLYNPPLKSSTLLLWIGPFVVALIGVGSLVVFLARRNKQVTTSATDASRKQKAASLLQSSEPKNSTDGNKQ